MLSIKLTKENTGTDDLNFKKLKKKYRLVDKIFNILIKYFSQKDSRNIDDVLKEISNCTGIPISNISYNKISQLTTDINKFKRFIDNDYQLNNNNIFNFCLIYYLIILLKYIHSIGADKIDILKYPYSQLLSIIEQLEQITNNHHLTIPDKKLYTVLDSFNSRLKIKDAKLLKSQYDQHKDDISKISAALVLKQQICEDNTQLLRSGITDINLKELIDETNKQSTITDQIKNIINRIGLHDFLFKKPNPPYGIIAQSTIDTTNPLILYLVENSTVDVTIQKCLFDIKSIGLIQYEAHPIEFPFQEFLDKKNIEDKIVYNIFDAIFLYVDINRSNISSYLQQSSVVVKDIVRQAIIIGAYILNPLYDINIDDQLNISLSTYGLLQDIEDINIEDMEDINKRFQHIISSFGYEITNIDNIKFKEVKIIPGYKIGNNIALIIAQVIKLKDRLTEEKHIHIVAISAGIKAYLIIKKLYPNIDVKTVQIIGSIVTTIILFIIGKNIDISFIDTELYIVCAIIEGIIAAVQTTTYITVNLNIILTTFVIVFAAIENFESHQIGKLQFAECLPKQINHIPKEITDKSGILNINIALSTTKIKAIQLSQSTELYQLINTKPHNKIIVAISLAAAVAKYHNAPLHIIQTAAVVAAICNESTIRNSVELTTIALVISNIAGKFPEEHYRIYDAIFTMTCITHLEGSILISPYVANQIATATLEICDDKKSVKDYLSIAANYIEPTDNQIGTVVKSLYQFVGLTIKYNAALLSRYSDIVITSKDYHDGSIKCVNSFFGQNNSMLLAVDNLAKINKTSNLGLKTIEDVFSEINKSFEYTANIDSHRYLLLSYNKRLADRFNGYLIGKLMYEKSDKSIYMTQFSSLLTDSKIYIPPVDKSTDIDQRLINLVQNAIFTTMTPSNPNIYPLIKSSLEYLDKLLLLIKTGNKEYCVVYKMFTNEKLRSLLSEIQQKHNEYKSVKVTFSGGSLENDRYINLKKIIMENIPENTECSFSKNKKCKYCEKWYKDRMIFKENTIKMIQKDNIIEILELMDETIELLPNVISNKEDYHKKE